MITKQQRAALFKQCNTVEDRINVMTALHDYETGLKLLNDPGNDVCVVLNPMEVPMSALPQETGNWAKDDLFKPGEIIRAVEVAKEYGYKVHITILDTNHRLSPKSKVKGFRDDISFDTTNDDEMVRPSDHFTLIVEQLYLMLKEAVDAGVVTFSGGKVLWYKGIGYGSQIKAGCIKAAAIELPENTFHIINHSFGGSGDGRDYTDAYAKAVQDKRMCLIASAGNSGGDGDPSTVLRPAANKEFLSAGAYGVGRIIAIWSSKGKEVDVSGPGVRVKTKDWNNKDKFWNGTSSAGPSVVAAAAVVALENPAISSNDTMQALLMANATDLGEPGKDVAYGEGATPVGNYFDLEPDGDPINPPAENIKFDFHIKGTAKKVNGEWVARIES